MLNLTGFTCERLKMKNAEDLLLSFFFFGWKYWSLGVDFDCSKYGLLAGTFHWRRAGAGSVSSYHFAKWIRTNLERKRRILLKLIHWSAMMKDHKRDKLKNIIRQVTNSHSLKSLQEFYDWKSLHLSSFKKFLTLSRLPTCLKNLLDLLLSFEIRNDFRRRVPKSGERFCHLCDSFRFSLPLG